ncbi:hypothetical protein H1R20_g1405, partial [Candolleomyces eurysporus]
MYGFRIKNNTKFPVFPYLFYFDNSDFSITPIYQPVAVAQPGSKELSIPSLPGNKSLAIGYGSAGATPQNLAISNVNLDQEQGHLYLYVSTLPVDLSFLKKGSISEKTRGFKSNPPPTQPAPIWGLLTVPVVIKRGDEPTPPRMIGIIGSKSNGKSAFLEEVSKSLYGNTIQVLKPSFKNAFIKEYNITLPGPDGESLTLVDLPAFEDSNIYNHVSVLKAIVAYLGTQYQQGRQLSSLIWCYNISKPRFTVVDGDNLNLVKDITGPNAIKNVTVLTTNWNKGATVGANVAKPRTMAPVASSLQRYEKAESQLKTLFGTGVTPVTFERFGTFSDPAARKAMLDGASTVDPSELIRFLLSNKEEVLQVQSEACETKKLSGTTAGNRLRAKLELEIQKKRQEVQELIKELEDMAEDDTERKAIQEETVEAGRDILRWKETLESMDIINSAFVSHTLEYLHLKADEPAIAVRLGSMDDGPRARLVASTSQANTPDAEHQPLVTWGSTCFVAKDAFDHLARRQKEILKAVANFQSPIIVLAGFNEELVREGIGLLQEIHIFPAIELSLEQCNLVEVGKLSAPFPSVIFLPSGKILRPPLHDAEGQAISVDRMVASSISSWRYSDVDGLGKGLAASANLPENAPSDGSGGIWHRVSAIFTGEPSTVEPSMASRGDRELAGAMEESGEGGAKVAVSSEDSSETQRIRRVHFDVLGRIYHDQTDSELVEEFQVLGDLDFQFTPTRSRARVQFTRMKCQARRENSHPTIPFQYLQSYLKILVNAGDARWKSTKIHPEETTASENTEKRVQSDKTALQTAAKASLSPNIFKSSVSGEVTQTGEELKSAELVYNRDRIIQDERLGVFRWDYHVDDESAKKRGVRLPESRLPLVEMKHATKDRDMKPEELKIEVSSFWSLVVERTVKEVLSAPGQMPLPGYSNLCQDVWFDLGNVDADADVDDNYIATLTIGRNQEETLQVIAPSRAIFFMPGMRKPSDLERALEKTISP